MKRSHLHAAFAVLILPLSTAMLAASSPASADEAHLHAAPPQASPLPSPVTVAIDDATRAAIPREPVTAVAHGNTLHCEGVSLAALLHGAGVLSDQPLGGARLSQYVLVNARDGYRVLYSLAELAPSLGSHEVLLVDRCDGEPLNEEDGPLRLIAPAESRPARWVRQVQSITVVSAP